MTSSLLTYTKLKAEPMQPNNASTMPLSKSTRLS